MSEHKLRQYGQLVLGSVLFCAAVNLFVEPAGLNTGGIVGLSQILSYLAAGNGTYTGWINFAFNIPLFILSYKAISRSFFVKTVLSLCIQSVLLTLIPIPAQPILSDILSNCIFGAVIGGIGIGLCLLSSGSAGGMDILGVYFSKKSADISVGKISYAVNFIVLSWSALLFDVATALYSIIFIVIMYFVCDKVHYQNINVYALIITEHSEIRQEILEQTGRGVTYWMGKGAYTGTDKEILLCMMNRYEVNSIKKLVRKADPKAFFLLCQGNPLLGNFEKRLIN